MRWDSLLSVGKKWSTQTKRASPQGSEIDGGGS